MSSPQENIIPASKSCTSTGIRSAPLNVRHKHQGRASQWTDMRSDHFCSVSVGRDRLRSGIEIPPETRKASAVLVPPPRDVAGTCASNSRL